MMHRQVQIVGRDVPRYVAALVVAVLFLFPFVFMVLTSFKAPAQLFEFPPRLIPRPFVFDWYKQLFQTASLFGRYYFNSVYLSTVVAVGVAFFGSLAGFSFAKIDFKFKNLIFLILLSSLMVAKEAVIVPQYIIFSRIGWTNTHLPLLFPPMLGAGGIFALFLCRKFYVAIPDDLLDAAKIDGCTQFGTYRRVILPLSRSILATAFLLTFLSRWDNLLDPLVFLNDIELYTLPLAISMLNSMNTGWAHQMAASTLATIPVLIVFLFAQKQLVRSISLSGLK
jgi:multiple sugar transport system permease protein